MNAPLLEVENLSINFRTENGLVEAVKRVSLSLEHGGSLAIVGESGSGKSVTALSLARLLPTPPAEFSSGSIRFEGRDILAMSPAELRAVRGGGIAYVFQEPATSLNPVFTIRSQIAEGIRLHRPEVKNLDAEVAKWLGAVGIVDPEKRMRDYPHQLSGGMQQRAMIAMALACRPRLLIADEPTTALDVTIQAQILAELRRLRAEFDMALILITHNFGIIRGLCDRVAVMFRGEIVETGKTESVLENPQHPYTKALIACVPRLGTKQRRLRTIDYNWETASVK
ncbi:MAG: ABC transporter ATP-binding protein [Verrucomicrobia bacterium]|nr:ABC transporter ATP-binding protein [Verrucomicrobiota bacterium]